MSKKNFRLLPLLPGSLIAALLGLSAPGVHAQDLRRLEPQPIPEIVRPEAPDTESAEEAIQANVDINAPLGVNLESIIFFPRQDMVRPEGLVLEDGVEVLADELLISAELVPALQSSEFAKKLNVYKDIPLTLAVLENIKRDVVSYFESLDRPYVHVILPPQNISYGILQAVVVEGRVGDITVEGNEWFAEEVYLANFGLKSGDEILASTLRDDIVWINRNPFRNADIVVEAGKTFGATDLTIVTNERSPLRVYGGFDNFGGGLAGSDRMLAGFNWGNAFGLGHELNYQYTRSTSGVTKGHGGSYVVPLSWRHIFSVSAAYSETNAEIDDQLNSSGKGWSVDSAYVVPLQSSGSYSHEITARVPFKFSDNTLDFSDVPVTDNTTHVVQAELLYSGSWTNSTWQSGFNLGLIHSPGGLSSYNKDENFDVSRAGSKAQYSVFRAGAFFAKDLPRGFRWSSNMNLQTATDNLLGSEQIELTGVNAVRGYDTGLIYKDRGIVIRNELIAPAFPLMSQFQDSVNLFAFVDAGIGGSVSLLDGEEKHASVSSAGLGLHYFVGSAVSVNLSYGWQLSDDSDLVDSRSSQLHLSVSFGY